MTTTMTTIVGGRKEKVMIVQMTTRMMKMKVRKDINQEGIIV
jgi:hypothetical protein